MNKRQLQGVITFLSHLGQVCRQIWTKLYRLRYLLLASLTAIALITIAPLTAQPAPPVATHIAQATTPAEWMAQGRARYQATQYTDAIAAWQQAMVGYQQQNDPIHQSSAQSNLGLAHLQLGQYPDAERHILAAQDRLLALSANASVRRILAQALSAQGQLAMAQGNAGLALQVFDQAAEHYAAVNDDNGSFKALLNQVQILRVQGRYGEMQRHLRTLETQLAATPESPLKVTGLRLLGQILHLAGQRTEAIDHLENSRILAEQINDAAGLSATLLTLGNLTPSESAIAALDYYDRAAAVAPTILGRLQADANAFGVLVTSGCHAEARSRLATLLPEVMALPPSRAAFFVQIHLASQILTAEETAAATRTKQAEPTEYAILPGTETAALLAQTTQQAQTLGDGQGQTYGLGYLGKLYELNQQWDDAVQVTQTALAVAQSIQIETATYQWQWQLGRIYEAQEKPDAAIKAYQQALDTLKKLRGDLVTGNADLRFSFREDVEPIYRHLVSLLLQSDSTRANTRLSNDSENYSENLDQALDVIESLQVETLVNFFRADCVVQLPEQSIDNLDTQAAVIYPIILNDRLEVVLSLPEQPLRHASPSTPTPKTIVNETLALLQDEVSNRWSKVPEISVSADGTDFTIVQDESPSSFQLAAQQAYDWLVRPFEAELEAADTDTLVFVLDGSLRNVPMAVLLDGERYLIQKYAIALAPGLQLIDPQPLAQRELQVLAGGLSQARGGFSALPNVAAELAAIQTEVPGQILLNNTFNKETFATQLTGTPFPVVHLATHGQFGDTLEDTFIVAWDGTIDANELSSLLQASEISRDGDIELLVLSACETATGSERTALGLAGIAVRSGARSTLATLWQVDDAGTALLMGDFYQRLANLNVTKAGALRQAQLSFLSGRVSASQKVLNTRLRQNKRTGAPPQRLEGSAPPAQIDYRHPYYWAPFVLIGNWL